jgi:hypothetical protein
LSGVNVMITNFGGFCNFRRTNWSFYFKKQCYVNFFFCLNSSNLSQDRQYFAHFSENIIKIITLTPA